MSTNAYTSFDVGSLPGCGSSFQSKSVSKSRPISLAFNFRANGYPPNPTILKPHTISGHKAVDERDFVFFL